ncbi:MAG: D-tyrosyl-tRNA(Tyr) deacylase [Magnetococcales bacterium]|nr:D-tyrosyl-tRNA(Tyr) deacylase [Magnetococcales bacterium]
MKLLLQRVLEASVSVEGEEISRIGRGLLLFAAVEKGDGEELPQRAASKVAGLRIFPDAQGKTNLSLREVGGAVLVVSQFTLAADLRKGFRPSFGNAEIPARAEGMCEALCRHLEEEGIPVGRGRFAADMKVALVNDGPFTIWLEFSSKEA